MRATPGPLPSRRRRGPRARATAIAVVCVVLMALAGPAAATGGGGDRYHDRHRQHHRRSGEWERWRDVERRPAWHRHSDGKSRPSEEAGEGSGKGADEGNTGEGSGKGADEGNTGEGGDGSDEGNTGEGGDGSDEGNTGEGGDGSDEGGAGEDSGVPGSEELLFYRRTAGQPVDGQARGLGEYLDVGGAGELSLINALDMWSIDHAEIVPLEIDGTDGDELLFYRPQPTGERGWGEFYDIGPHGGMTLIRRVESWSTDHAEVVAIDIDGDGTDELVFYRRDPEGQGTGWGEIYDVTPHAGMSLLSRHTDWPTDHDMVIGVDVPGW